MNSLTKSPRFPLFILMFNLFIALLGQGMVIPILPDYLKQFHAGGTAAGYLIAAFGAAQFIFSPIGGRLADRYGRKKLIMSGLFLTVISDFLFAIAGSLPLLYFARFIGGIALGLMVPANMAYIADITTHETRAKGMGYLGAAMNLGMVLGPGLGGMIAEFGIRVPYFFASGLSLAATLLTLALPETLTLENRQLNRQPGPREKLSKKLVQSFQTPYFRYLLLIFVMTFGLVNYETVYALFVEQKYNLTAAQISIVITLGAVIGIVVQIWLLDWLIRRIGEQRVIQLSLLVSPIALILMLPKVNTIYLLAVSAMFFMFNAFLRPTVSTLISKSAGNSQGYAAGLNTTYTSVGNIIGPILAGTLFDVNIHIPYLVGAAILFASLFLTLQMRNRPKGVAADHD